MNNVSSDRGNYNLWVLLTVFKSQGGAKNPYTSKDVLIGTFLIYHFKQKKQIRVLFLTSLFQSAIFALWNCTLNADKRPETAFSAEFLQNQDTRCPAADLRHLLRCKGDCRGITLLALPGGSRGAVHRGMKSLEFRRLRPVGMAVPYSRWALRVVGSGSSIPSILWRQAGVAAHW